MEKLYGYNHIRSSYNIQYITEVLLYQPTRRAISFFINRSYRGCEFYR